MAHNFFDETVMRRAAARNALGKWGRMHLNFLESYAPALVDKMERTGTLWDYLKAFEIRLENQFLDMLDATRAAEDIYEDNFPDWQSFFARFNAVTKKVNSILKEEYVFVLPDGWDDDDLPF